MRWKLTLGLALSALFLYLAFRGAQLDEIAAALRSADYIWLVPMIVLTLVAFFVRALRWRYLLASVDDIRLHALFAATMVGFMGNNVLPARLGELMRVYAIGKSAGISRSTALGSIVIERILDVFVLLLLFAIVLFSGRLPEEVRGWGGYLVAVALPVFLGLLLFRLRSDLFLRAIRRFSPAALRDRLLHIATNFRDGLGVMGQVREMAIATALSLLMWSGLVGVVAFGFLSLGRHLPPDLPPDAGVVVLVVMAVGTMIPSAPGFIGTLQYAGTLALLQYDVDRSVALSFTLIYHAVQWLPITAIGLYYFLRQQLSLRQIELAPDSSATDRNPATPTGGSGDSDRTEQTIGRELEAGASHTRPTGSQRE